MEALAELDESMEVSADKCIGCGLCVSTCPEEAMTARYSGTATEFGANPLIFQAGNLWLAPNSRRSAYSPAFM